VLIGKGPDCRLRLPGWKIGREHARIYRTRTGLHIQDLGQLFGSSVNGNRLQQYGPIAPTDQITVGPFTLVIEDRLQAQAEGEALEARAVPPGEATPTAPPAAGTVSSRGPLLSPGASPIPASPTPQQFWRKRIHEALLDAIDLRRRDLVRMSDAELRAETESLLIELIDQEAALPESMLRHRLRRDVLDETGSTARIDRALTELFG